MEARQLGQVQAGRLTRPVTIQPAGFWVRFVASMIDGLAVGIINFPTGYLVRLAFGVKLVTKPTDVGANFWAAQVVAFVLAMAVAAIYYGYFYTQKGWSPGKRVMGLRVLNVADGTRLSFGQAIGRELGKMLSGFLLMIGFLMAAVRKDKRALHDLMAGSQVVRDNQ